MRQKRTPGNQGKGKQEGPRELSRGPELLLRFLRAITRGYYGVGYPAFFVGALDAVLI